MLKKIIPIISILCFTMLLSCNKEKTIVPKGINCDKYFAKDFLSKATSKTDDNLGMYSEGIRFGYIDSKGDIGFSSELVFNNGKIFLTIRLVHPNNNLCLNKHSTIAFEYSPEEIYILDGFHKLNCVSEHHNKDLGNYAVGLYELPINSILFKKLLVNGTPKRAYVDNNDSLITTTILNDDSNFKFANIARCIYESSMGDDLDIDDKLIDNTLILKK